MTERAAFPPGFYNIAPAAAYRAAAHDRGLRSMTYWESGLQSAAYRAAARSPFRCLQRRSDCEKESAKNETVKAIHSPDTKIIRKQ